MYSPTPGRSHPLPLFHTPAQRAQQLGPSAIPPAEREALLQKLASLGVGPQQVQAAMAGAAGGGGTAGGCGAARGAAADPSIARRAAELERGGAHQLTAGGAPAEPTTVRMAGGVIFVGAADARRRPHGGGELCLRDGSVHGGRFCCWRRAHLSRRRSAGPCHCTEDGGRFSQVHVGLFEAGAAHGEGVYYDVKGSVHCGGWVTNHRVGAFEVRLHS